MRSKYVNSLVVASLAVGATACMLPAFADTTEVIETRSFAPLDRECSTTTTRTTTTYTVPQSTTVIEKPVVLSSPVVVEKKTVYRSYTRPVIHHTAVFRHPVQSRVVAHNSYSRTTISKTIERPVYITKVVKQPVYVNRVVERPVVVEKTRVIERPVMISRPTIIERRISSPVVVEEKVKHHSDHDTIKIKEEVY